MKRTAEVPLGTPPLSVVRFTDFAGEIRPPSDESLGYSHPSATADWGARHTLCNAVLISGLRAETKKRERRQSSPLPQFGLGPLPA